jgi:hypothetical protein
MRILKINTGLLAILLTFLLPLRAQNHAGLTAREYYEELLAVGGLAHAAGDFACFQDDPKVDSFFILRESNDLPDGKFADASFNQLPEAAQEGMKKDFLMVRGYPKGIPWRAEEVLEKVEDSWTSDQRMLDDRTPIRIRFSINWQTLQYKYAVEVLNMDSTFRGEIASFGRCEEVPAGRRHKN